MAALRFTLLIVCSAGIAFSQSTLVTSLVPLPPASSSISPPASSTIVSLEPTVSSDAIRLVGWEGCSSDNQKFIKDSFDEFERMVPEEDLPGDDESPPGYQYPWIDWKSAPAIDFFGPADKTKANRTAIRTNLNKLASVRRGWLTFWTLHVRCDDPSNACDKTPCDPCNPGCTPPGQPSGDLNAYTLHGGDKENHVNFCPSFFLQPKLDDRINNVVGYEGFRDVLDNYISRAFVVAHELMHVSWIGTPISPYQSPWVPDIKVRTNPDEYAYSTMQAKYLSYGNTLPVLNLNNVNNYIWYALAQYIIHTKDFYPSSSPWNTDLNPPPRGS